MSVRIGWIVAMLLPVATLLSHAPVASAHAQYGASDPAANATISALPSKLQITYTEEVSDVHISVLGPDGAEATTAPASFDLEHRQHATVPLHDAGPGKYTVLWHNVSGDDGDPNDGSFVFTVAGSALSTPQPGGSSAQPAAATNATAGASSAVIANSPSPSPSPSGSANGAAAPTCVDNGLRTPGINDARVDTYCKRQALRDKYAGQIDAATFNAALADGEGFESALKDAMSDFQAEQQQSKQAKH